MKFSETAKYIIEQMNGGIRPVINILDNACNEFFCGSPGMLARIVGINNSDEMEWTLFLDFSEFMEHNEPLFTRDYYNAKTKAFDLTAREAGFWPANNITTLVFGADPDCENDFFTFSDDSILKEWAEENKKNPISYVDWLVAELKKARGTN